MGFERKYTSQNPAHVADGNVPWHKVSTKCQHWDDDIGMTCIGSRSFVGPNKENVKAAAKEWEEAHQVHAYPGGLWRSPEEVTEVKD